MNQPLDSELEPGLSAFDRRRLFSLRGIWTYALVGLALLLMASPMLWQSGTLDAEWSGGRVLFTLLTILYGLGLGWMIYPRSLR